MNRRTFVAGMAAVMAAPFVAEGQQPGRTYRLGILLPGAIPHVSPAREAFNQVLSEFGFVVGQNLVTNRVAAEGHTERLPMLAAELVKRKVDVIVAVTTPAAQAAKQATSTIPIVISGVADPVIDGLIESLPQPGGNITGATDPGMEASSKLFDLIRELLPSATRVVMTLQRGNATARRMVARLDEISSSKGLNFDPVEVGDINDLEESFARIVAMRPDAMFRQSATGFYDCNSADGAAYPAASSACPLYQPACRRNGWPVELR